MAVGLLKASTQAAEGNDVPMSFRSRLRNHKRINKRIIRLFTVFSPSVRSAPPGSGSLAVRAPLTSSTEISGTP